MLCHFVLGPPNDSIRTLANLKTNLEVSKLERLLLWVALSILRNKVHKSWASTHYCLFRQLWGNFDLVYLELLKSLRFLIQSIIGRNGTILDLRRSLWFFLCLGMGSFLLLGIQSESNLMWLVLPMQGMLYLHHAFGFIDGLAYLRYWQRWQVYNWTRDTAPSYCFCGAFWNCR